MPAEGRGYSEADIPTNPLNPLQMAAVWKDFRQSPTGLADDVQTRYAITNDGGSHWAEGQLVDAAALQAEAGPVMHSANYDAEVRFGPDGALHVVNAAFAKIIDQDLETYLFLHTSRDGGRSWDFEIIDKLTILNGDVATEQGVNRRGFDQPSFAVDREGKFTVTATIHNGLGSFVRLYDDDWNEMAEEAGFGNAYWLRVAADNITAVNYKSDGENLAILRDGTWTHQKTKPSDHENYFGHTLSVIGSNWSAAYGKDGQLQLVDENGIQPWISGDFSRIQAMKTGPDGSKAALVNVLYAQDAAVTLNTRVYVDFNDTIEAFDFEAPGPGTITGGNEYSGLTWNNGTYWAAFAESHGTNELAVSTQAIRLEAIVPVYETTIVEVVSEKEG